MNNDAVFDYNPDMHENETKRIGGMILHDRMMMENVIKKENIGKMKESPTTIFPTSCESEATLSGFVYVPAFQKT